MRAPAPALLALADVLTPERNRIRRPARSAISASASIRTASPAWTTPALHALCRRLLPHGTVVVTLGAAGVFVSHADDQLRGDGHHYYRVAAEPAHAVDTTGAGDAFNGALAASLANAPQAAFAEHVRSPIATRRCRPNRRARRVDAAAGRRPARFA